MRKIALFAALTLTFPTWAQDKPAAPVEPAKPAAPMVAETAKPKPAVVKKANPRRQEDARHCLEKASNEEVIKCAEAYL